MLAIRGLLNNCWQFKKKAPTKSVLCVVFPFFSLYVEEHLIADNLWGGRVATLKAASNVI